jgi:hypothetical protein
MTQRTLVLLAVTAALMSPVHGFADVPRLETAEAAELIPIDVAFARIRPGMLAESLFRLMAPYKVRHTGHYQWRHWTDGKTDVFVTIWPEDFDICRNLPPWKGPWRVYEKSLAPNRAMRGR